MHAAKGGLYGRTSQTAAKVYPTRPYCPMMGFSLWQSLRGTYTPRLDPSKSFGKIRSPTRCILYQVTMTLYNSYQRYNLQNLQNLHATCKNLQNLQELLQVANLLNIKGMTPKLANLQNLQVFLKNYTCTCVHTHTYMREKLLFFLQVLQVLLLTN